MVDSPVFSVYAVVLYVQYLAFVIHAANACVDIVNRVGVINRIMRHGRRVYRSARRATDIVNGS